MDQTASSGRVAVVPGWGMSIFRNPGAAVPAQFPSSENHLESAPYAHVRLAFGLSAFPWKTGTPPWLVTRQIPGIPMGRAHFASIATGLTARATF